MKIFHGNVLFFISALVSSEAPMDIIPSSPNLTESVCQLASLLAHHATLKSSAQIHNLNSSADLMTLLSTRLQEGDHLRITEHPHLSNPRTYVYYGIAQYNPPLTPDPQYPGYYLYKITSGLLSIYSQYQRCEDGIMLRPENEFFELEVTASLDDSFEEDSMI